FIFSNRSRTGRPACKYVAVLGSTHGGVEVLAGSRALIARIVAVFALLFCAVVALRGHIPGMPENSAANAGGASAVLSVVLMPVLFTVSIVVLLARVIASQHRLPLAMPDMDADDTEQTWRLGRFGLFVLFVLA